MPLNICIMLLRTLPCAEELLCPHIRAVLATVK
jgi:hypothetical protein